MKVEIIAEAGVNHNGNLAEAMKLACVAKQIGADVVKFQTYIPEFAIHRNHPEYALLKSLALSQSDFKQVAGLCANEGIEFMSTPGDTQSLEFLVKELKVKRIKIGSDDLNYIPLLRAAALSFKPLILSTGMANEADIESALVTVKECALVTLLHCVSSYPCAIADVNLKAMDAMRKFGRPVGYSDHTAGTTACIAAAARGAVMVEKHFMRWGTTSVDRAVSADTDNFADMVLRIRMIEEMLGTGKKVPCAAELKNKPLFVKDTNGLKLGAVA